MPATAPLVVQSQPRSASTRRFRFGAWLVDPSLNSIENADGRQQMEPRTMDVLLALCYARGEIVSAEALLAQCWGSNEYSDGPVHKNIAQLRRILGDKASTPRFIETIRMRGYRTVAPLDFDVTSADGRKYWEAGSPFRGLLAFDEAHAEVFFGREEASRELAAAVRSQVDSGFALMLVLGPSGSGKTSLIQAGLLPALSRLNAADGFGLLATTSIDLIDQGEQTLFTTLAGALLDLQWSDQWAFPGENAISLGIRLEHGCDSVIADLGARLAAHAPASAGLRFAIFIDRFEAFFNAARVSEPERLAFLATLERLARSGAVVLIVACRNDFYPSLAKYPVLTEGKRHGGHFDLGPPGSGDIAQIIRNPAAAAKLTFGVDPLTRARLDDILCESAAASPDALPLLQYCLQELYRLRTEDGELSFAAFHALGNLEGAIGQRAEQVVLALSDAQRAALPHIMSLLIVLSADDNVSSQRAPWTALRGEDDRQAVHALIESRLFVSDLAGGTPVFGIAHDALLRHWPRMSNWSAEHRDALRARGRLAQQAGRWRDEGCRADLLLPIGKLLDEAKLLQQAGLLSLTHNESEFIHASDRRARQRERLRLFALTLIVALAVIASGLGATAMMTKETAELRRAKAEGLMDFMLGDLADKLRPLGRLDFLDSVSGKTLEYLRDAPGDELSQNGLTLRAKGLQIIGEVSRARGESALAVDALNRSNLILMRQHQLNPRDIQVLKNLGANAYWVGQIHKDQNNWTAAGEAWRQYLMFSDLLHRLEPDNPEWWLEQSYAHNNLGNLADARGMPAQAVPEFEKSIALKQAALKRSPGSHIITGELADSYSWLASAKESLGELLTAQGYYAVEMQLVLRLRAQYPADAKWTYYEMRALRHRALIGMALGRDAEALRDFNEAAALFTSIARQDPKNRTWQVELATLEQERLYLLTRSVPMATLLPDLMNVHRTTQALLADDPRNALWARREAVARTRVAAALLAAGKVPAAEQEATQAIASLNRLYADNRGDMTGRLALIESLLLLAAVQQSSNNNSSSVMTCKQAHAMIENDSASSRSYRVLAPWIRINACLRQLGAAQVAVKRLEQIGYRDHSYVQFISTL